MVHLRELGDSLLESTVLEFLLRQLLSGAVESGLEQSDLALQVLDLVHPSELEVLAQLRKVLNRLLVLFPLPDELGLLPLDLLLLHFDPSLLLGVDGLPHGLSVLVVLGIGCFESDLSFVELRCIDEVAPRERLVDSVGLIRGGCTCLVLLGDVQCCLV